MGASSGTMGKGGCDCTHPNIFGKEFRYLTFEKGCCFCCNCLIGTYILAVVNMILPWLSAGGGYTGWFTYIFYFGMGIGGLVFGILAIVGGCTNNWKFVHFFTMWQVFCFIWSIIALIVNIIMYISADVCTKDWQGNNTDICVGVGFLAWAWLIALTIIYWICCILSILVTHTCAQHICGQTGGGGVV